MSLWKSKFQFLFPLPSKPSSSSKSTTLARRYLFQFLLNPEASPNCVDNIPALTEHLDTIFTKLYAGVAERELSDERICRTLFFLEGNQVDRNNRLDKIGDDSAASLYIFPSGQGDSSVLSIDHGAFTMLIDGGFLPAIKSFWEFVRHFDQIDTHVVSVCLDISTRYI